MLAYIKSLEEFTKHYQSENLATANDPGRRLENR